MQPMPVTAQQTIRTVHELFNSSVSDAHLVFEFNLFHSSVTQKLWSVEYYCNELINLDVHKFLLDTVSITESGGSTTIQRPLFDPEGYCRHLNLWLDGFLMNSMSALDTLAHEISTLYSSPQRLGDIYIVGIKNMLLRFHPNSRLGKFLDIRLGQPWFDELQGFRHCTTHESLIRYDDIKFSFDPVTYGLRVSKIKLPDNAKVRPFTYHKKREVTSRCQFIRRKIQSLVFKAYESILMDIHINNNILPI